MKRFIAFAVVVVFGSVGARAQQRALVLVLPFEAATPEKQWVGKAVQQNLVAELSSPPGLSAAAHAKGVAAVDEAASLGRAAKARYVILGGVQAAEQDLRITGMVIDVASSQPLGAIKATGAARDIFALQDEVAAQAKQALGVSTVAMAEAPARGAIRAPATVPAALTTTPATVPATRVERAIARIEQGGERVRQLEEEIDRLKDRIRDLERETDVDVPTYRPMYDDYYPYPYFGNYYYSPALIYTVPICKPHHRHLGHRHLGRRHFPGGLGVSGSFRGRNVWGGFRLGGGGGVRGGFGGGGRIGMRGR